MKVTQKKNGFIASFALALLFAQGAAAGTLKTQVTQSRLETTSIAGLGKVQLRLDDTEAAAGPRYRASLSLECANKGHTVIDFAEGESLCDYVGLEHDEKRKKLLLRFKSYDSASGHCGKPGVLEYDISKACR